MVILTVLPQIQRREWWQRLNLPPPEVISDAILFAYPLGGALAEKCTRVSHEVVLKIARLAISMEPTPLLEKVSSYSLLPRLWHLFRPSEPLLPKQIKVGPNPPPPHPTSFFVGSDHVIRKITILFKASQYNIFKCYLKVKGGGLVTYFFSRCSLINQNGQTSVTARWTRTRSTANNWVSGQSIAMATNTRVHVRNMSLEGRCIWRKRKARLKKNAFIKSLLM